MKWIWPFLLLPPFALAADGIYFLGSRLEDKDQGQRVVLTFYPKVPPFTTKYVKNKNASQITWKSEAIKRQLAKYLFPDTEKPYTQVIVWADPKQRQGVFQLWHRNSHAYRLDKIGENELALLITPPQPNVARNVARDLASVAPTSMPVPGRILTSAPEVVSSPLPDPGPRRAVRLISLEVKQSPLDKVLRTVAAEAQRSIVFGDEVLGAVTISIKNIAYEEAINLILKATKYRAEHTANTTVIRSAKEGKSFKVFQLRFIDVNAALKSVQEMVKDGQVTSDTNSNTIFVSDTMDSLNQVERMLQTLDQIPRQVDVEAAILEIDEENAEQLGVNIGGVIRNITGGGPIDTTVTSARVSPFDPAAAAPKGMFVGLTWQSVQAMMGALQQKSKFTILARPRIVALNDTEASIIIGSKVGYKTLTVTTTGTVEDVKFLVVGTQLKIKPHITHNDDVLMQIKPEVSDGGLDAKTGLPTETTTSSETKVLVQDGQTIVIGGLLRDRTEKKEDRVPFLADIPLFGFFFRGVTESIKKTEVMILLSPKIVNRAVMRSQDREQAMAIDKFYSTRLKTLPPPTRSSTGSPSGSATGSPTGSATGLDSR